MKTLIAHIHEDRQFRSKEFQDRLPEMAIPYREILALLGAVTVATATILLSIWVATSNIGGFAGASSWGVALVFIALALDSRASVAWLQLATSIGLVVLAWLQSSISPDYLIGSGILVAAWLAVAVFKQLR